ncbi:MAG: capsular polysaccharide biosynthesis protein [Pseudomonadota bacterium]
MIGLFSKKISEIPFLSEFLESNWTLLPTIKQISSIAGWGLKPTADKARAYAQKKELPYISLEDGFLRSLGLGSQSPPISIIVDKTGIYYDFTKPSDLENLLNSKDWETPDLLNTAKRSIKSIIENNLSKYNHAPEAPSNIFSNKQNIKVLVLDQTMNDMSIIHGGANKNSFEEMLHCAIEDNPDAEILIKTHPDVIAGKKRGYLLREGLPENIKIIDKDYCPLTLLRQADIVYTVTSQMGFEALLLGKTVHCFGMPFYSGWGVTNDRLKCQRRKLIRSVEAIFAAAYILYARYINPFTGKRCSILEAIQIISDQRRRNETNRGLSICVGLSRWKRGLAKAYLRSTSGRIECYKNLNKALKIAHKKNGKIVIWAAKEPPTLEDRCKTLGINLLRIEDGFIRSVGLGSDFNYPYSLVLDKTGIYYNPQQPSNLEKILQETEFSDEVLERAHFLRKKIIEHSITKYNIDTNVEYTYVKPGSKRIILVVGQVEEDASVRLGGCGISTNFELLQAVRNTNPEAHIIYKPHPDVISGNRPQDRQYPNANGIFDELVTHGNLVKWLDYVDEVHTLTSLAGFESLIRGIPVSTYGGPFYAGWGLTSDKIIFPRRTRRLSLDELVAGVLIIYAAYHDWVTGQACTPEAVIYRLTQGNLPTWLRFRRSLLLGLRNTMRFLHLAR